MHKLMPLMVFMGLALASFASATPAHAQAPRTWVSRVGNDGNPCSTTAPCRTFAGAIAKTPDDQKTISSRPRVPPAASLR